jgi:hypothetical protein
MSNNIYNSNNNNNQIQTNYWIWFAAYIAIGLAISFIVPFPISFGIALIVYFLLNMARTHIALKRRGVAGGIKELYKSMSSSLTGGINNSTFGAAEGGFGYSSIKFYCMNCGYEHKKDACPKCGSKAVRAG